MASRSRPPAASRAREITLGCAQRDTKIPPQQMAMRGKKMPFQREKSEKSPTERENGRGLPETVAENVSEREAAAR